MKIKWSENNDAEVINQCKNIRQIVENDISNKLALEYKDNTNISYNPLFHEKYPKIDTLGEDDIYNNLTRVRVGGYCSETIVKILLRNPLKLISVVLVILNLLVY